MARQYLVGKGIFKKTFDEAYKLAKSGDTLLLSAGEYWLGNNFSLNGINVRGNGETSKEVVLNGLLHVSGVVHLENLTISTEKLDKPVGVLKASGKAQLTCDNCRFICTSKEYCAVYLIADGSTKFENCEVRMGSHNYGLVTEKTTLTCQNCIIEGLIGKNKMVVTVDDTQLSGLSRMESDAQLLGKHIYLDDNVTLVAKTGGQIHIDQLVLPTKVTYLKANHGLIQIKTSNVDPAHRVFAQYDRQSTIECEGAEKLPS